MTAFISEDIFVGKIHAPIISKTTMPIPKILKNGKDLLLVCFPK